MKQYSTSELNRELTVNEKKILSLEQSYMNSLVKLFKKKIFLKSLNELEINVNEQYTFIKDNYSKNNKIEIAVERLLRYHLYRNYGKVKKAYPSPISSDIAFETKDAIINLDSKTLNENKNKSDFKYFHFISNQSSFDQEPLGKTANFPGLQILSSLPKYHSKSNKPVLSFVIRILYSDDDNSFKLFSDNEYKGVSITCLPNGELSLLFKNNIIIGYKDYSYSNEKKKILGKASFLNAQNLNISQEFNNFEEFRTSLSEANFDIPETWNREIKISNKYGFYDDTNNMTWVIVKRGNNAANYEFGFENVIRGNTPRIAYETLKNRLTRKDSPWLGHVQWNIESELKKKW
jgi:hypothetical protein